MGLFDRFRKRPDVVDADALNNELNVGLSKTRRGFMEKVFNIFSGNTIDDDFYENLEETLIQGDVGVHTTLELVEALRDREKKERLKTTEELGDAFAEELAIRLGENSTPLNLVAGELNVILVVGVNGVGKTTSIGKIAHQLKKAGNYVILGAADTFRAAATEQLKIWGQRVGCEVIAHQSGADPAAVVFDAIVAAKSRKADVLIIDTAGRLHNKVNLMNELAKIRRIIDREAGEYFRETLLVLDATTGQNALSQARVFQEATGVTGVVLTKLDGSAKGGVVIGVSSENNLPIKFVGIGEGMEDLKPFDPRAFAQALFLDDRTERIEESEQSDVEQINE